MQISTWREFGARIVAHFPWKTRVNAAVCLPVVRTSIPLWGAFPAARRRRTRRTRACGAPGCTVWRSGSGSCSADRSESPRCLWVAESGRRSSNTPRNPRHLLRTDWAERTGAPEQNAFLLTDLKSSSLSLSRCSLHSSDLLVKGSVYDLWVYKRVFESLGTNQPWEQTSLLPDTDVSSLSRWITEQYVFL